MDLLDARLVVILKKPEYASVGARREPVIRHPGLVVRNTGIVDRIAQKGRIGPIISTIQASHVGPTIHGIGIVDLRIIAYL